MRWRSAVLKISLRAACMAMEAICFTLAHLMEDAPVQCRDFEVTSSRADCYLGYLQYRRFAIDWVNGSNKTSLQPMAIALKSSSICSLQCDRQCMSQIPIDLSSQIACEAIHL